MKQVLKGITWNHSRGFVSVVATSQRFSELFPNVEIKWEKRSLQEFADAHIGKLVDEYDLLVIDHPWSGFAKEQGVLQNLNTLLPLDYLKNQASNSVGRSFESYNFGDFLCALPIDAATPIATYRSDLLTHIPKTFDEVLELAKSGRVLVPAIPIDSLMNFFMLYATQGGVIGASAENPFEPEIAKEALTSLKQLTDLCPKEIFQMNPIKVYEKLTSSDDFVYCPFAYGYSAYSVAGYAKNLLNTTSLVSFKNKALKSTLGGTGMAISAKTDKLEIATKYLKFTCSPEVQKSIYSYAGGQPGHRAAWVDDNLNSFANDFYKNTLSDLDNSFLRPRFSGYLDFQDEGGLPVHNFLKGELNINACIAELNRLFKKVLGGRTV